MFKIETDVNKRWEEGMDHHPESIKTIKAIGELDFYLGNDSLCVKTGGDGVIRYLSHIVHNLSYQKQKTNTI
ncbi:hypothetical protein GW796_08925 [archaeon]|nr:hypothetical protein [archaeon]NCQ52001.1 hypothetical protein [archaeon]